MFIKISAFYSRFTNMWPPYIFSISLITGRILQRLGPRVNLYCTWVCPFISLHNTEHAAFHTVGLQYKLVVFMPEHATQSLQKIAENTYCM